MAQALNLGPRGGAISQGCHQILRRGRSQEWGDGEGDEPIGDVRLSVELPVPNYFMSPRC